MIVNLKQDLLKNTVPVKYLLDSALIKGACHQLSQQNHAAKHSDILAFLVTKMESEPNKILADLYQQAINQMRDI